MNSNNALTLDVLEGIIKDFEENDTVEFKGKKIRLSRMEIYLPANRRGELVGIDAEVINFHAKATGTPVVRHWALPPGTHLLLDKDRLTTSAIYK